MATVEDLLREARKRIFRVVPSELAAIAADGGLIVDIRPEQQRREQGSLPGAIVIDRNVFEWRLDPCSPYRVPEVTDGGRVVVVVCGQGFSSSLAAASLVDLGYRRAGDLIGGYEAWASWFETTRSLDDGGQRP